MPLPRGVRLGGANSVGDNSIINVGDLSKPANTLIEKISSAVGGIFKPYQLVRVARAEAEAERIRAQSQIEITDLHRRAMLRFLEEEAKKQTNIESITAKALPLLDENAAPEHVDDDWITNFFDKSRIVSDDEMQELWGRVLAGEANSPGTFSRQTVNLLCNLDSWDAALFTKLYGFAWAIAGDLVPLIFNLQSELYTAQSINFDTLSHLDSLGVVKFAGTDRAFQKVKLDRETTARYFGKEVKLKFPGDLATLSTGMVMPTRTGSELCRVCGARPVDGFFEAIVHRWNMPGLMTSEVVSADRTSAS